MIRRLMYRLSSQWRHLFSRSEEQSREVDSAVRAARRTRLRLELEVRLRR